MRLHAPGLRAGDCRCDAPAAAGAGGGRGAQDAGRRRGRHGRDGARFLVRKEGGRARRRARRETKGADATQARPSGEGGQGMSDGPEWFAPKRYGYGSGIPISWQGWTVTAAYIAIVYALVWRFYDRPTELIAAIALPTIA